MSFRGGNGAEEKEMSAFNEVYFHGHACLTGDCPHEKTMECLEEAFLQGQKSSHLKAQIHVSQLLREIDTRWKPTVNRLKREIEVANEDQLTHKRANAKLREQLKKAIEVCDDHGDIDDKGGPNLALKLKADLEGVL